MVKFPQAGKVKTRLARQVGDVRATGFYRAAAAAVIGRLSCSSAWETVLAVAPDRARSVPIWPRGVVRIPQGRGDLGQRMQRLLDRLHPGPAVIVGTDIPAIRPHHIRAAFKGLGGFDAVLGPASDGGYWLVGLRRRPRRLSPFADVRWSTPNALADTLRNLSGRRVMQVARLSDVDDADDLRHAAAWSGRRVLPALLGRGAGIDQNGDKSRDSSCRVS